MLYFGIFGLEFENTIVIFEINPPQICLVANFVAKMKIWHQKCLIWVFLGCFHTWNQNSKIYLKLEKFREKLKIGKSRTKNALFGCFGQEFWKIIVIFEISTLGFVLLQSLVQK